MSGILLYPVAFMASLLIFLGIALPMLRSYQQGVKQSQEDKHAFSQTPLAALIWIFAQFNSGSGLATHRQKITDKLLQAGKPGGDLGAAEFIGIIQIISLASFLVFFILFTLIAGFAPLLWLFAMIIAVLFYWLGYVWLDSEVESRRTAISRQFPYFLDLAVMTMESGSSFMETLAFYVRDNPEHVLAEEMQIVIGEMRMGKTISESLEALKNRIASEDVQNTVNALLQGQSLGTPLGQVLRNQAEAMRFRRSQMAERIAEELKVKLQGPAMLMVISVLILILAPAFLETTQGGMF